MHKFLRAVGFSKITKEEMDNIFQKIIEYFYKNRFNKNKFVI